MLATRIRNIRMIRGMKQSSVADDMNISQQAYCKFEKDYKSPRIDTLIRFCKVMKIEISFLLDYDIPVTRENMEKYGIKGYAYLIEEHKILKQKLEFLTNLNKIDTLIHRVERTRYIPMAVGQ